MTPIDADESAGTLMPTAQARRFYLPGPLRTGELVITGDLAHRLTRVLRLPAGSYVTLFDGAGGWCHAQISRIERLSVHLTLGATHTAPAEPVTRLLVGLMRATRFEWLIEKAVELGATDIQPVITAHSAVRPDEVGASKRDRWARIAGEAAEQCGRWWVPPVDAPRPLGTVQPAGEHCYVAVEPAHGGAPSLSVALATLADTPVTLLVGPEGGLTPDEVAAWVAAGGARVSLGPTILRAETAALAALAITHAARRAGS